MVAITANHFRDHNSRPDHRYRSDLRSRNMTARADVRNARSHVTLSHRRPQPQPPPSTTFRIVFRVRSRSVQVFGRSRSDPMRNVYIFNWSGLSFIHTPQPPAGRYKLYNGTHAPQTHTHTRKHAHTQSDTEAPPYALRNYSRLNSRRCRRGRRMAFMNLTAISININCTPWQRSIACSFAFVWPKTQTHTRTHLRRQL